MFTINLMYNKVRKECQDAHTEGKPRSSQQGTIFPPILKPIPACESAQNHKKANYRRKSIYQIGADLVKHAIICSIRLQRNCTQKHVR